MVGKSPFDLRLSYFSPTNGGFSMLYVLGRHQTSAARCSSNCSGVTSRRFSSSVLLMVMVPLVLLMVKGHRESDEDGEAGATSDARQRTRMAMTIDTESDILK